MIRVIRRSARLVAALAVSALGMSALAEEPAVKLTASMPSSIEGVVEMTVSVEIGDGWSASEAGLPKPLLQLDPGEGAALEGKVLEGRAQARNDYLFAPFERMIDAGSSQIPLRVVSPGETIGVNLVAYVRKEGEEAARFVRRRVDLPLVAGSTASSSTPSTNSRWGPAGERALSIGEKAPDFELPRADGTTVHLSDYKGKHDVIITTYRAHW